MNLLGYTSGFNHILINNILHNIQTLQLSDSCSLLMHIFAKYYFLEVPSVEGIDILS